jgi:hypothetical protein
MEVGNLAWLITKFELCMKSTDLSWEGEEPSATADEEDPSAAVEESVPLPQAETVVQVTEATPLKATIVEGTWTSLMLSAPCSSRNPRY